MASFPKISAYCRTQPEAVLAQAPIIAKRAPTANDINYPLGTIWINTVTAFSYILSRVANNAAVWAQATTAAGDIDSVTGNAGGAVLPVAGNVNLLGDTTTITSTGAGATLTFGLVASPVITGTLTVNNGLDVLAGGVASEGTTLINTGASAANTSIGTGANTGTVAIGNVGSTAIDIIGPVFINESINDNTRINTGTSTGSVTIGNSANTGAISLNSAAASNFLVSGAGVDLTLQSVGGSVIVNASEAVADSIQLTTAATGGITVNASSAALIVHRAVNVDAAAGVNAFTSTSLTTGVAGIFTSSAATVDAVQLVGGGLKVAPVVPGAGASPRAASGRFGVAAFTDVINAAATVALAITNTMSTGASHVMATVQCSTAGSACIIRDIDVSVAGTITCNVTNLGGSATAANVVITFWVMD